MSMKLDIRVSKKSDGFVFQLDPDVRKAIRETGSPVAPARKLFVTYETYDDFGREYGPVFDHVALAMTGLPKEKLAEFGGVRFIDALSDRTIYRSYFRDNANRKDR